MSPFDETSEEKTRRINEIQREMFDKLYRVFEPPLPEGVPERLEQIAAAGEVKRGSAVLDVGSGTGILVPLIRKYEPAWIYACDLSEAMLGQLARNYPDVETIQADVRDLVLPDDSLDVVFVNACYPNIADKAASFSTIGRMLRAGGRLVISHPLGKAFIDRIREGTPFPLDDFPEREESEALLSPFGFAVTSFVDEPELYVLVAEKNGT
jgi:ubiquinone/menaquinone biosynthesis C-methylase UbiE